MKLYHNIALLGAASVVFTITLMTAKPASAQRVTICQSINYQTATCSLDTQFGVDIVEEYSHEPCLGNWGYRPGYVWVTYGCRAKFRSIYPDGYDNDGFYPPNNRNLPPYNRDGREQVCPQDCPDGGIIYYR